MEDNPEDFEFIPVKKTRSKKTPEYNCSSCGDKTPENFYKYLPSKCIKCKRKYSKERRSEISNENKLKEVENLDPDGKIRDALENLLTYDKVIYGNSILEFIKDTEARISSLELEVDDRFKKASTYISGNFKLIEKNQEKISQLEKIIEAQNMKISELIQKIESKNL